jgi:acetyl esterase
MSLPQEVVKEMIDPRYYAAMSMDIEQPPLPVYEDSNVFRIQGYVSVLEQIQLSQAETLFDGMPEAQGVENETVTIKGEDDNDIELHITRPTGVDAELPCLLFLHGGGMCIHSSKHPMYTKTREFLAAKVGAVVVGVEFRNAGGVLGPHPFPAGLHDCRVALQWANGMRGQRRFSKVVLVGDSGGGNLCCALALLAKSKTAQELALELEQAQGQGYRVDGVYALCPYISNLYLPQGDREGAAEADQKLPSLALYDGVGGLFRRSLHYFAQVYDPSGIHSRNPLAWPYYATQADLSNLPPFVVSLNELDPLHDEGKVFFRKLMAAGVTVRCRTVNGTAHCGDLIGMKATHEIFLATMMDVKSFVDQL